VNVGEENLINFLEAKVKITDSEVTLMNFSVERDRAIVQFSSKIGL